MNLQKKLANLGIEDVRKLDNESIRIIARNVTESLTKTFPAIYDEYNNILIKLLNCNMYVAKVTKPISRVNYMYEDNSIYFDEELNLNKLSDQMIHECIHYLQDYRNMRGNLDKIGLCNFDDFKVYGLGLNEAAVQYISAKTVGNTLSTVEKYGIRIKTVSPNYYPFLTNLIEQIVYLMGEDILLRGTIKGNEEFEDFLLNTFEGNTKKIIRNFDEIVEINNKLNIEHNPEKINLLQQQIANIYVETQNMIFSTYFEKICPRLTSIQEIDFYMDKAIYYKNVMGVIIAERFSTDGFYDVKIQEITEKFNKRLYEISKEKSRNTLSIISGDRIMRFIKRILSYFTA